MTPPPRRSRGVERKSNQAIPQLPRQSLENPFKPYEVLNAEKIASIHDTSMRLLEEVGIELMSPRALDIFASAGAQVDRESMIVRMDRAMVLEQIKHAPREFSLTSRNPEHKIILGGNHLVFGLVAGPPNTHDEVSGRRQGNYEDYCNLIRLAQHFNIIHMIGNQVVSPIEIPANNRHLDTYLANILYSDMSYHCSAIGRGRALDGIRMMAISRGISLDEIKTSPGVNTIISVNSPRRFDDAMAEGLIAMAEYGQAVSVTPFTLMGAMTPVTLAAALAQQNAEALFGVVLTQLVNPGNPVMYGAFTSNVDMRSGAPAFGTPENTQANIASGQLARHYNLPYRSSNANAANTVDAQAAYETQMSTWGAMLGHANLIYHAAGWLEGGLVASFEKLVLDVEILQEIASFLQPLEVSNETLAFDAIKNVPSGGHFFGEPHTMARYKDAFYQPILSDWSNHESWEEKGAKTATQRATEVWQKALKEYQQPYLDDVTKQALEEYVAKRKEEIGSAEP